jgi:dolichol-phosphate mannosyltransferase
MIMSDPGVELTVVAPTLDERDNIAAFVAGLDAALRGIAWEVVFVDDDSPDGTAAVARALSRDDRRVRVIQRLARRGLASACVEGVLSSSAPFIAVMDADLQHDATALPQMLARLRAQSLDVVIGSRYVPGGSIDGWEPRRLLWSRLAARCARRLLKVGELHDPLSGFFMLRREAFEAGMHQLSQHGFKILPDILASAPRPLQVAEIPYTFAARRSGASKFDSAVIWEFAVLVLDKLTGRLLPARFVLFCIIGGSGVLVHLAALSVLRLGLPFPGAQSGAVLVAMTSNYVLNNAITYRDQRLHGREFWRGLLSFYLVCAVGALANVGIARLIYARGEVWWLAGLAGALIGAVWNYAATRVYTWRPRPARARAPRR